MKIASQTEYVSARLNDCEAVRMVCEAGFDAIDFSMFHMKNDDCPLNSDAYVEIVKEIKAIADSYGKPFCQAHAPFPTMKDGDEEYNKNMLPKVKRSIEIAGMLGVENIVVHPGWRNRRCAARRHRYGASARRHQRCFLPCRFLGMKRY